MYAWANLDRSRDDDVANGLLVRRLSRRAEGRSVNPCCLRGGAPAAAVSVPLPPAPAFRLDRMRCLSLAEGSPGFRPAPAEKARVCPFLPLDFLSRSAMAELSATKRTEFQTRFPGDPVGCGAYLSLPFIVFEKGKGNTGTVQYTRRQRVRVWKETNGLS